MKKGKGNKGICAYCKTKGAVTRDHIPPKALFAKPRPENTITVPACTPCHEKFSKDDEYFRDVLSLQDSAYQNSDAKDASERFFRAMERPEGRGYRHAFLNTLTIVELLTPAGIYCGDTFGYKIDRNRILRVVIRIIRGLFFHEFKKRLSIEPKARFAEGIEQEALERFAVLFRESQGADIGDQQTFHYRFRVHPDEPETTVWALSFYNSTTFLAVTRPQDKEIREK